MARRSGALGEGVDFVRFCFARVHSLLRSLHLWDPAGRDAQACNGVRSHSGRAASFALRSLPDNGRQR